MDTQEESSLLLRGEETSTSTSKALAIERAPVKPPPRRTCNLVVAIIAATILLAAAAILILNFRSEDNEEESQIQGARAIAVACNATRFPETCVANLDPSPAWTPLGLTAASVAVATDAVSRTLEEAIALRQDLEIVRNATYTGLVDDCVATVGLARAQLERSSRMLSALFTNLLARELQTFLSGALTLTGYCGDGLTRVATARGVALRQRADLTYQIVSNALAFVNALAVHGEELENWTPTYFLANARRPPAPPPSPRRLLLSASSFPEWFGVQDRRALVEESFMDPNVTVALDGSGNFASVQAAVNAAPVNGSRFVIYIKAGVYHEIVRVGSDRINLMFLGDGVGRTVISGNLSVQVPSVTTFKSATVGVDGDGFIAKGITIQNTAGPAAQQAVALRISADKCALYQCSLEGFQDTLWTQAFRQFYKECTIMGTVDFVFGNAAAVLQDCRLLARANLPKKHNVYTAQGRSDPGQCTGYLLHNCSLDGTPALKVADQTPRITFLGRPWKRFSLTVVSACFVSEVVNPAGWLPWSGDFALDTLFYGEYGNNGPGAITEARVNWSTSITNPSLFNQLRPSEFLAATTWLPNAGMPFTDSF